MTDEQLHAKTLVYAKDHCLSYAEALGRVVELTAIHTESAQFSAMPASDTDAHLDFRARTYSAKHQVSYAEALTAVCGFSTSSYASHDASMVSFSEIGLAPIDQSPASAIERQLVEIFRAGRHVTDNGQSLFFSFEDIQDIAQNYSPELREAPLVLGHPQTDGPAQGWVKGLQATEDGRLLMAVKQVAHGFAQMLKEGRFKKRSASFYSPSHPNNPKPGKWYLRHVGWLGAQQPAIAGLQDVAI
ncbi:MAG: hypothetical protein KGZ68_00875 [Dechloromonas sp.]|jgi:hypothetical protein|nr:hypothetical protein [Dechloromonas sp.]